jgi:hypothetical protein|tara:strand:- start:734 stop:973 length:240 start_codon:yes stop_codon:yes gene_type:complete
MVKVKIRTGRGTGTIEVELEDLKFSGEEFKQIQKLRKQQAGNISVSTGRGTGKRKLKDIPDSLREDIPGTIIDKGTRKR